MEEAEFDSQYQNQNVRGRQDLKRPQKRTSLFLITKPNFLEGNRTDIQGEYMYGKLQGAKDGLLFSCCSRQREIERGACERGGGGGGGAGETHEGHHDHEDSGPSSSVVGRTFRYMRRIPTIIEYKPPDHGNSMHKLFELTPF